MMKVWLLVFYTYYGGAQQIGPFGTLKECNAARAEMERVTAGYTVRGFVCLETTGVTK